MKNNKPQLARDPDALIAAEKLYQNFTELINAGFTKRESLYYLATLVATMAVLRKRGSKK